MAFVVMATNSAESRILVEVEVEHLVETFVAEIAHNCLCNGYAVPEVYFHRIDETAATNLMWVFVQSEELVAAVIVVAAAVVAVAIATVVVVAAAVVTKL